MVDPDRLATRGLAGFYIPPPVPDQKTPSQVDAQKRGCILQESGLGFAAMAPIAIVVIADLKVVDAERCAQMPVYRFDPFTRYCASCHVRLIRNHYGQKAGLLQGA